MVAAVLIGGTAVYAGPITVLATTARDVVGPAGSESFGEAALVLSNGNYVVVDSLFDGPTQTDVGAVFLYDGATNQLITRVTGSTAGDHVGSDGVTEVGTSDFVIASSSWDSGAVADAGAATWVDGTAGLDGVVSEANSLVGATADDLVGSGGVTALTSGDYVVASPKWDDAVPTIDVGAATLGDGATGAPVGPVTDVNSLVGSTAGDQIGVGGVTALTNGNYVVDSPFWTNGAVPLAGAVTWGDGATGTTVGAVTDLNSLVGTTLNDNVGISRVLGVGGVTALTNGNYVVASAAWDSAAAVPDVGAVTLGNGTTGSSGAVSAANSLVGTVDGDLVGLGGVTALTAGRYAVASPLWNDGAVTGAGAVTRVAATGLVAEVGPTNSLVGTTADDNVGSGGVAALTNGNYVVASPLWDNSAAGVADVGAVTLGDGILGTTGPVTASASLIGTSDGDQVGSGGVTSLTNDDYVVASPFWDADPATSPDAGAATWRGGLDFTAGTVTGSDSLVGTTISDLVGIGGVIALTNGNYVVLSPAWDDAAGVADVGAATLGDGATGTSGAVTAVNSLVGAADGDLVGLGGANALVGGQYVVVSPKWANGAIVLAGAATFGPATGVIGAITTSNSVFGTPGTPAGLILTAGDRFTTDDAIVVSTAQNRVLLLRKGEFPSFVAHDPVSVTAAPGALSATVTYTNPTATQRGGSALDVACSPTSGSTFAVGVTNVTCSATDDAGFSASTTFTVTVDAAAVPSDFTPLAPARLADTRSGATTVDGSFAGEGIRDAGSTLELVVAGRGGVAAGASAVALNVTAVDPTGDGFVTVYPCGAAQPNASNLNFTANSIVPNAVIAKIGDAGKVCIFVSQRTHLVVDVGGFFPASTALQSINPARVIDTRAGQVTVDGQQQGDGQRAAGSITTVQITGRAGVPADAAAVVLNVTMTETGAPGFATVYPCGIPAPNASTVNYGTGSTVANMVVSKIGSNGAVCVLSQSPAHLIVDVGGYFPAASTYQPLDPARLLDTRTSGSTVDDQFHGAGLAPANSVVDVQVTGRGGVATGAAAVVLNVTVTETTAPGFVTVYPCGITRPLASNLNYTVGTTAANAIIVQVGAGGTVCLFNSNPTQLIADVVGYLPG